MTFNNKNGFPLYIGLNLLIKFEVQPSNTHISNSTFCSITIESPSSTVFCSTPILYTGSPHEVTRSSERSSARGASNLFPVKGTAVAYPSPPACCWRRWRRLRLLLFGLRDFCFGATYGGFVAAGASHRKLSTARASVSAIPLMLATSAATALATTASGAPPLGDVSTSVRASDETSGHSWSANTTPSVASSSSSAVPDRYPSIPSVERLSSPLHLQRHGSTLSTR